MKATALLAVLAACSPSDVPESPSHSERAQLVTKHCSQVTNPFFYSLTKDGKTSFLLGAHIAARLRG
ncbi:MAG: hypothetical protein ACKV2T_26340 [Kofleriaceae bacterium]